MREFVLRSNRVLDNGVIRPAHSVRTATNRSHEISPYPSNNRAAQQFSQSCPRALPSSGLCPFGGACHACPARVQAKLTVSQPNDPYEQEADRVADQVMSMQEPRLQRACPSCEDETLQKRPLAEQITPLVQRQEEPEEEEEPVQAKPTDEGIQRQEESGEEEEEAVQTKREGEESPRLNPKLDTKIQSLRSGGAPLPPSTRSFFEQRFGSDFGDVRVHSGLQASEAANSARAQAFTVGRDIVFGKNQYSPESQGGQRLLAHELTHVLQQQTRTLPSRHLQRLKIIDCRQAHHFEIGYRAGDADKALLNTFQSLYYRRPAAMKALTYYFGNSSTKPKHLTTILYNLAKIRMGMKGATIECENPGSILYKRSCGKSFGYVRTIPSLFGFGNIHICQPGFHDIEKNKGYAKQLANRMRMSILVHEGAHRFCWSGDKGYYEDDCTVSGETKGLSDSQKRDNADSYACITFTLG
jgi:hypothetical protein